MAAATSLWRRKRNGEYSCTSPYLALNFVERGKARQLFLRHTGVGGELAFSGVSSQLDEFLGSQAVAADQLWR